MQAGTEAAMRTEALLLILAAMMAANSTDIAMAGETAEELRAVAEFDRVVFRGVGELSITQDERELLLVEAEPEVLAKISTEVAYGVLNIAFREAFATRQPIRFRLTVRDLRAVDALGSGTVLMRAIDVPRLDLRLGGSSSARVDYLHTGVLQATLSGAGELRIAGGSVDEQNIRIDGSGRYAAGGLSSGDTSVQVGGSGVAELWTTHKLYAQVSGAGQVRYFGDPQIVQSVSGSGRVARIGGR
jgi:hypothetical protein